MYAVLATKGQNQMLYKTVASFVDELICVIECCSLLDHLEH
jgi:hypothetical protein